MIRIADAEARVASVRITGLAAVSIYRIENWRRSRPVYWNRPVAIAYDKSLPKDSDISPALASHSVPVSVIQGDNDCVDPGAGQWIWLSRDRPSVDVTVIDRAGHNAWIDDPDAFKQAIARALARHVRRDYGRR